MNKTLGPALALAAALACAPAGADERQELLKLRNTTLNLIQILVDQGVLSQEKADALIAEAEHKAQLQAREQERRQAEAPKKVVRVPYVPEFVREEIRAQVRSELREDVVQDVMAQARNERWGVPDALPEWISRIKVKGDIRLRAQTDRYASGNANGLPDFQAINDAGGFSPSDPDQFLNTTEDRNRFRARMRLGVSAKISNYLKAGVRLATGKFDDPVSTNQTLGNYNERYALTVDRAYLQYDGVDADGYPWLTLSGGRIPNPFLSTDLVWDPDISFEGFAATFRTSLIGSDNLWEQDERTRGLFFTLGGFPLQEEKLSADDKWLVAGQLGLDWRSEDQSRLRVGLAYYDYINIDGRQNPIGSTRYDFTAPAFTQGGNSMFAIGDVTDPTRRFGLASQYKLVNLTARWDYAGFAPTHVILDLDLVKNIGWDRRDIIERTGGAIFNAVDPGKDPFDARTTAYQVKLTVGWPKLRKARDWQVFSAYKYIERDAVLDAFTDSDFHLGGSNAKGWVLGAGYGLTDNTWLRGRWLSSDEVDGAPYGIDTFQLDLNAKF